MIFAIVNALMGGLFTMAVVVQYNDPDPLQWMLMYGAAAFACFYAFRGSATWKVPAVIGAVSLVWALMVTPAALEMGSWGDITKSMQAATPSIELRREMIGLWIITAWMTLLTWHRRPRS